MYDLCLINPPSPGLVHPNAQAPLGLLYVAAAARAAGYRVCIHDAAACVDVLGAMMGMPRAPVYGITGYHTQVDVVNALACELKAAWPNCRVVVGGPVCLSADELDDEAIDALFCGPGETALPALMGGSQAVIDAPPIEDLDVLPFPARDLWPGSLGGPTFMRGKVYFPGGSTGILASRGCPNACAFCANPKLTGCKRKVRNPALVVAEMELVVKTYGIREFTFWDEYFNADAAHVMALCEAIGASRILGSGATVAFRATVAAKPSIPRMWRAMWRAGCREVSIGIESGDDDVLRAMHKRATVADNTRAVREAKAAGLNVRALMMVGTPGQTPKTLQRDIAWVCENREYLDLVAATVFVPMPGSAICEHPERFGCTLRDLEDKSIASYRPDGLVRAEPHIDIEGMDRDTLRRHMQVFLDFLDATEGLHRG